MTRGKEMITDDDRWDFTTGGCLVLAATIADQTGWPIHATWGHAFIKAPSGKYLDVNGLQSEQEMMNQWGVNIYPQAEEDFDDDWYRRGDEGAQDYVERALQIAPELIALAA